jgi:hypothetical protein
MRNIRSSNTEVNEAPNNMKIASRNLKRLTISSMKLIVELHRSPNNIRDL